MGMVTTDEAKLYLRVDSGMEDSLVESLLNSAEKITSDVARMNAAEWSEICNEDTEAMTVRDQELLVGEIIQLRALLKTAVLYALGYLFEHREEADHHDMVMTLRNLLSSVREGVF